jgi:hypothetical protein
MNNIDRSVSPDVSPPGFVNIPPVVEQPQIPYDEDDHSGEIREYNGVFEGPEKTLGEFMSLNGWGREGGGASFWVECTSCVK